ncbi:hypothetical protein [Cellulomonas aerilata]|uniref:hypothetical protein n=1 Tax=Cellulomonas aerilata TaxID=515326 RepID=UPI001FE63BBC|nr:hypothetical protein [Cellulomonas aerilata]
MTAPAYLLEVRANPPRAILADPDGRLWSHLSLLASVDRTDVADESLGPAVPVVVRADDGSDAVDVLLTTRSSAWDARTVRLRCLPDRIELQVTVRGHGVLAETRLLGGRAVLLSGACGSFRSSIEYLSVFDPTPTEPVQVVRPAASAVSLGVVGDATAGRLNAVFSPPPLCLVLGRGPAGGPTSVPDGGWLAVGVVAPVADLTFTTLRYAPLDGGFHLELDYDGHTRVDGELTTPALVLRPAADPWTALRDHRADHVARGFAADGPQHPAARWWSEPIFCGWGAQCARAPMPGEPPSHPYSLQDLGPAVPPPGLPIAPDLARQDVYDELLGHLAAHGVVPGTIVVDDRWQDRYGTAEPDLDRWPDLRGWIADRHAAGQRVLLWWKAWDCTGLPAEECVTDVTGRPVCVDPGNPVHRRTLARTVARLLGPDGLDADGLKVDFTQRAPAGRSLRAHTDTEPGAARHPVWGIAGVHTLLDALYRAAKGTKPDALVVTHTPHPGFADVCDMVRLNDVLERNPLQGPVAVADQLRFRHRVATAALPGHLVDTDQWPMPTRSQWRDYVRAQAGLGVPALYYAERIDRTGEPLTDDDLALVARTWAQYRAGLTRTAGPAPQGVRP